MLELCRIGRFALVLAVALAGCEIGFPVDDDDDNGGDPDGTPGLTSLSYETDYERWQLVVEFTWTDPQPDVREGAFFTFLDGTPHETFDLPCDDVQLYADSGQYDTSLDPFTSPVPVDLGLVIEDTEGNRSDQLTHVIDLERAFFDEQESNDSMETSQNLGGIQLPVALLGNLSSTGQDTQGNYTGDEDYFRFTLHPDDAGTVTFHLYWPGDLNDLDMFLIGTANPVAADAHDLIPPEEMGADLSPGTPYSVAVAGVHGDPTDYVLLID
jgi:hypothetical protein